MSVPCLYDDHRDEYVVGHRVPDAMFAAQVGRVRHVDADAFRSLSAAAKPCIGLPRRTVHAPVSLQHLQSVRHAYDGVDPARIAWGQSAVPKQDDGWSCGVNSAARFSAMLRQRLKYYHLYKNAAPKYGGFLGIPHVGPNPEGLKNHISKQSELANTEIHQVCNVVFAGLERELKQAMALGRPALALFMTSGTSMHWVCLVGRNKETGHWYYMDTDGRLYEIFGGDEELKHLMNMDNCTAQKMNFVERFNCVVSTGASHEKD